MNAMSLSNECSAVNSKKCGLTILESTSCSVLWYNENFCNILKNELCSYSDIFRIPNYYHLAFYLSLTFKQNKFFVHICKCNRCGAVVATENVDIRCIVSLVQKESENVITKHLDLLKDSEYALATFEKDELTEINEKFVAIRCTISIKENCSLDSLKCFKYEKDRPLSDVTALTVHELKEHLKVLLQDDNLHSITISVEGEDFLVHQHILSYHSPVFAAMLHHKMQESIQKCITIEDIPAHIVGEMLMYMYTGSLSKLQLEMVMNLFVAADKYAVLNLKNHCSKYLASHLTQEDVLNILVLANKHVDEELKYACISFLTKDISTIESDQFLLFLKMEPELGRNIFLHLVKEIFK
ncbi:TD and POZ domain-containing protein 4-like [Stegodyphus dumicola]|uniref:TD and POZ domain-containing protein 4-like n=1 Tax=Stegodyphus dumicola TaxID=202533 RepID=UPI0015AABFA3|nr:TD and POZ domain-containing protein 4-like [Stegodyphus dumicola]